MGVRRFSLPEKAQFLRAGKEDSYERNPGGMSFVFNHKFFEPFERIEKLVQSGEKFFDTLSRRTHGCPPAFFCRFDERYREAARASSTMSPTPFKTAVGR